MRSSIQPTWRIGTAFPPTLQPVPEFPLPVSLSTTDPVMGDEFVLLQYRMGPDGPQVQGSAKTGSGGALRPGTGLNDFTTDFGAYTSSRALIANFVTNNPDVATALSNDSVITFTLAVGTNVTDLDLTDLSFNAARGGTNTPRGHAVYVTNPVYPQVFGPTFAPFCEIYAQSFASTKTDPYLLGYFSDNELNFPSTMLTTWLARSPGNSRYEEAWRWLRERHGPGATTNQGPPRTVMIFSDTSGPVFQRGEPGHQAERPEPSLLRVAALFIRQGSARNLP